jgi:hypothetical protein
MGFASGMAAPQGQPGKPYAGIFRYQFFDNLSRIGDVSGAGLVTLEVSASVTEGCRRSPERQGRICLMIFACANGESLGGQQFCRL